MECFTPRRDVDLASLRWRIRERFVKVKQYSSTPKEAARSGDREFVGQRR